jgi:hypothetical protein
MYARPGATIYPLYVGAAGCQKSQVLKILDKELICRRYAAHQMRINYARV